MKKQTFFTIITSISVFFVLILIIVYVGLLQGSMENNDIKKDTTIEITDEVKLILSFQVDSLLTEIKFFRGNRLTVVNDRYFIKIEK